MVFEIKKLMTDKPVSAEDPKHMVRRLKKIWVTKDLEVLPYHECEKPC